jgi:hypothetical protein
MIKILIVLEEEDGMDFRAYALQISNKSKGSPPHVKLHSIDSNDTPSVGDTNQPPSHAAGSEGNNRSIMHQMGRPLETRQIFMN